MMKWVTADLDAANANRAAVPVLVAIVHKLWWMDSSIPDGVSSTSKSDKSISSSSFLLLLLFINRCCFRAAFI